MRWGCYKVVRALVGREGSDEDWSCRQDSHVEKDK